MKALSKKQIAKIEQIVSPLKAWDEGGQVFGVCIQLDKPTQKPNERSNWQEVRLERQEGQQWFLIYSFDDVQSWEVYRGKLPMDRQWWLTLLMHADMNRAGRIVAKHAA